MSTILGEKDVEETKLVVFDFSSELESGETISTFTRSVVVLQGVDSSPDSVFSGAAVISGHEVLQRVTAGVEGVQYHFRGRAVGNTGLAHVVSGDMRVVRL